MVNFVHIYKIRTIFTIFCANCIILTTFVYLQCKLALQVQSKHIKILKKKNKKQKQTKHKPTGILEGKKKKKENEKVHLTN